MTDPIDTSIVKNPAFYLVTSCAEYEATQPIESADLAWSQYWEAMDQAHETGDSVELYSVWEVAGEHYIGPVLAWNK